MNSIMQGTTPSLTISIDPDDFLLSDVQAIELYVANKGIVTTYTQSDLLIDTEENTVTKKFTEAETAAMSKRNTVTVQGRFWFPDGSVVGIAKITLSVADMIGVGD